MLQRWEGGEEVTGTIGGIVFVPGSSTAFRKVDSVPLSLFRCRSFSDCVRPSWARTTALPTSLTTPAETAMPWGALCPNSSGQRRAQEAMTTMHLRAEAVCGGSAALMCGPVLIGADGWDVRGSRRWHKPRWHSGCEFLHLGLI